MSSILDAVTQHLFEEVSATGYVAAMELAGPRPTSMDHRMATAEKAYFLVTIYGVDGPAPISQPVNVSPIGDILGAGDLWKIEGFEPKLSDHLREWRKRKADKQESSPGAVPGKTSVEVTPAESGTTVELQVDEPVIFALYGGVPHQPNMVDANMVQAAIIATLKDALLRRFKVTVTGDRLSLKGIAQSTSGKPLSGWPYWRLNTVRLAV